MKQLKQKNESDPHTDMIWVGNLSFNTTEDSLADFFKVPYDDLGCFLK